MGTLINQQTLFWVAKIHQMVCLVQRGPGWIPSWASFWEGPADICTGMRAAGTDYLSTGDPDMGQV